MNNFQELNLLDCCKQVRLCTKCYVDIRNTRVSSETPPPRSSLAASLGLGTGQSVVSAASSCPFCSKLGFKVLYKQGLPFDYSQDRSHLKGAAATSPGTGNDASEDVQIPPNSKSIAPTTATSASATVVSTPEELERNLYVPKSSTADRKELEEQLLKQHLYGQSPPGERVFYQAPSRSGGGSGFDRRRSGSAGGHGGPKEQRALRLSGAVRRSVMGTISSNSSGNSSPRSPESAGKRIPGPQCERRGGPVAAAGAEGVHEGGVSRRRPGVS